MIALMVFSTTPSRTPLSQQFNTNTGALHLVILLLEEENTQICPPDIKESLNMHYPHHTYPSRD